MKNQVVRAKLKKVLISTIAGVFLVFGCLTLTACGESSVSSGQTPVYQGMEISSAESSSASMVSAEYFDDYGNYYDGNGGYFDKFGEYHTGSYNPYQGDYSGRNEDIDCEKPFGDETPSIEKQIESSLKVVGAGQSIYYADKNEDIFITIKFSNPDSYEILSFVLNGTKYTSYMFQEDSDLENIIIKLNVGSYGGILEYTIDEIKYVDGKEIKDVLLNGDTVVKCGVRADDLTYVTVSGEMHDLSSISFTAEIVDIYDLIESSDGYAMAFLYDGESLVQSTTLTIGTNEVQFTDLSPNTLYQYAVVAYYDDLSGEGTALNYLYTNAIYTDAIVLFDEIEIGQESISFSYSWYDGYNYKTINSLILTKDSEPQTLTSSTTYVDGLLSNTQYTLTAYYTNLNNQTESISLTFSTKIKSTPTIEIRTLTSTQSEVYYALEITDTDNVGAITSVSLLLSDETVQTLTTSTGTFSGLLSNNTYTLSVVYKYNLNDGVGDQTLTVTQDIVTKAKSTPTVEITLSESDSENLTFSISFTDEDDVGEITAISLYSNNELVASASDVSKTSVTFSNLSENTQYTLIVYYTYNLNEGDGFINASEEVYVYTDFVLGFDSFEVLNTSAVSEGETITVQAELYNPNNVTFTQVVVNGETYEVSSLSTSKKLLVEILNYGQFVGGDTELTISAVYCTYNNETYLVELSGNNTASVFINGELTVENISVVRLSNDVYEETYYGFYSEQIYYKVSLDNITGYEVYSLTIGSTTYNSSSITMSDDMQTVYVAISKESYGMKYPTLSSISYSNSSLDKTKATDVSTYYVRLKSDEIVEISTANDLLDVDDYKYYKLANDIDLSSYEWANMNNNMYGVFDGNGYSIKNMRAVATYADTDLYLGLFRTVYGFVFDLTISDALFVITLNNTTGNSYNVYAGALASKNGNIFVSNCDIDISMSLTNANTSGYTYIGGLIGYTDASYITLEEIEINAAISASTQKTSYVGGVAGDVYCYEKFLMTKVNVDLTATMSSSTNYDSYFGVAYLSNCDCNITDCTATSKFTVSDTIYYYDNEFIFLYEDGEYSLVDYLGTDTNITLPNSINGSSYSIGQAFDYNSSLNSITLSDGVISIGDYAFSNCTGLTSVTIGSGVTNIGEYAFFWCTSLTAVYIDSVETWLGISFGHNAFANPLYYAGNLYVKDENDNEYKLLTELTIPTTITTIIAFAFYNCTSLTSVTISDSITSIGSCAFYCCTNLTSVTIGSGVTSIGSSAFECCGLTSITIPDSVTSIGLDAFIGCSKLTEINFNAIAMDDLTSSSGCVFYDIGRSAILNIGANVTRVPAYLFWGSNIVSVVFAEGSKCESIGSYAFEDCRSLTSITIPDSITSIGSCAFYNCTALTEINFNATAMDDLSSNNGVFSYAGQSGEGITVNIGANVTKIPAYLFYSSSSTYAPNITSVMFADGSACTIIGNYAFSGCKGLTSITIPDSVTSIGSHAFYDCTALTEINFNATAMDDLSSGDYVFYNAGQGGDGITVSIGANVTKIPAYLFEPFSSSRVPKITSVVFAEGSVCKSIGTYAFYGCTSLISVTIGSGVASIGDHAFYECTALTEINFNATAMDDLSSSNWVFAYAGQNGTGITVNIGANVTKIPAYLFYPYSSSTYAPNITSVVFAEGSKCESIGSSAFYGCTGLTSITIPDSVTSIGKYALYGCSNLTSVTFADTSGWTAGTTTISSTDLADTSTAATYLTSTYYDCTWTRSY